MNPIELKALQPLPALEIKPGTIEVRPTKPETSFSDLLSRAVGSVDQAMKASDQTVEDFIAGKSDNVHDVMISMQKAQVSFQMMVEIRNKAIETYQEISRMQI